MAFNECGIDTGQEINDCELEEDDPDISWQNALFLLRVSQEHSLTHDGVNSFCEIVQTFTETLCHNIAEKIKVILRDATTLGQSMEQDVLDACKPGMLFEGLTSRHSREQYYETCFNYKVSNSVEKCKGLLERL